MLDENYLFTEDVTVYAVYVKKTLNVRFMLDNTIVVDTQEIKYGEHVTVPNAPARSGYTFKGWTLDGKTAVDLEKYEVKDSVVFDALFEKTASGGSTGGGGTGGGGSTGGGGTGGKDDGKKDDDKKDDDVVITDTVTFISDGKTVATQKVGARQVR